MNEVIQWLESPEGEKWSRYVHRHDKDSVVSALATVKVDWWDDEDTRTYEEWYPVWSVYFPHGVESASSK